MNQCCKGTVFSAKHKINRQKNPSQVVLRGINSCLEGYLITLVGDIDKSKSHSESSECDLKSFELRNQPYQFVVNQCSFTEKVDNQIRCAKSEGTMKCEIIFEILVI